MTLSVGIFAFGAIGFFCGLFHNDRRIGWQSVAVMAISILAALAGV